MVGFRQTHNRKEPHGIEERVETQTSPRKLEPHALGEQVICEEVHVLKVEVLSDEPGEQCRGEGHARVGIGRVCYVVRGGVRQNVELEVYRADEVEVHFDVESAGADDGESETWTWIEGTAQEQVGEVP